ncbi:MAG TPA: VWA domain-containing protein [Pyrinomonadaceae bacterium]|nr:VWA domain-containing protein [Pyrinomonadaceae bacterium]
MTHQALRSVLLGFALIGSGLAQETTRPQPTGAPSTAPAPPQSAAKPEPTPPLPNDEDVVRITTNLVQVDAVVTDKDGKPVTDLRADEIQILEDGRPQKLTNFSYVIADAGLPVNSVKPAKPVDKTLPPAPVANLRADQIKRTIALVVDDLGLSFESTAYVRRALKKFVDEQIQPGDLVAIVRTGGGIGALQQFTSDKRMLYAAIDRVKWNGLGRAGVSAFAPIEPSTPGSQGADVDEANEDLNQFREDVFSAGTLGAVNYVVKGLHELPGRKSILLISDGFRIYDRDDPTRNLRTREKLRQLIEQANRSSVVIYTMNATGLQTLALTAADSTRDMTADQVQAKLDERRTQAFDTQEGLDILAHQTGGFPIKNNNDLASGIRRVMEDQKAYYLIGYRPDQSTFDPRTGRRMFHRLSLKVTRPGKYNIRMRNGFFGVPEEERKAVATTPRDQIIHALTSPFGSSGIHVRLTSLFANDEKAGSYMRSLLHVAASDLTFVDQPDGWKMATLDVVAVTFGDNGNVVDQIGSKHTLRTRGERYEQMLREGYVYFLTVPIKKPGGYQLRAVIRDEGSERIGSASQFIEVPDLKKNRLSISGLLLDTPESAVKQTAAAGGSVPNERNNDAEDHSRASHSAAVRQFTRGQILQYGGIIYNAHLDKATGKPQVQAQVRIFRGGAPVFTGKQQTLNIVSATDLRRIDFTGALQLGTEMTPGEYVLQTIVIDLVADKKHQLASQWIDFEILK